MKKLGFIGLTALFWVAMTGIAHADEVCGEVQGYCFGACTPTYGCPSNPCKYDSIATKEGRQIGLSPASPSIDTELQGYFGRRAPVCAEGRMGPNGDFVVTAVSPQ